MACLSLKFFFLCRIPSFSCLIVPLHTRTRLSILSIPHTSTSCLLGVFQEKKEESSEEEDGEEAVQLVYDEDAGSSLASILKIARRKGLLDEQAEKQQPEREK